MRKITFYSIFLAGLAVSVNAAIIKDDVIKIDFGPDASAVAAGNWNDFIGGDATLSNLKRFSDNANTGVSIALTGINKLNGGAMEDGSAFGGSSHISVYEDYTGSVNDDDADGDKLSFTISGLDDALTYDLFGGFVRDTITFDRFDNIWDVGGDTQSFTSSGGTIVSFADYSGLSSASGQITFTISETATTDWAAISELTITAVPEPSNFALISASLALATVMLRRRRA